MRVRQFFLFSGTETQSSGSLAFFVLPTCPFWFRQFGREPYVLEKYESWKAETIITVTFWEGGYLSDTSLAEITWERLLYYLIPDNKFLNCLPFLFWKSTLEFLHWVTTCKQEQVIHAQSLVKPHICSFQERMAKPDQEPSPHGKLGLRSMTGHFC